MAYIASWLNDQLQAKEADLVIEDTLAQLKQRSGLLDKFIPLKTYSSRNFLMYVVQKVRTVASVIAYGAEPPATRIGRFSKIDAKMFKSGISVYYDEDQQWEMKEAMEHAMAKGIEVQDQLLPDGDILKGSNNDLAEMILGSGGTIADVTRMIVDLMDALTWQALQFGEINYTDARTNASPLVLNYKDPNATYNHFPSALTGSDAWTNYSTANGIRNLEEDIETYIDTNGYAPKMIGLSRKLRRHLLNQESTKQSVASISNASAMTTVNAVGTVSPEMLNNLLMLRDLPPIVIFDEQYEREDENKNVIQTRFLNTNRYVFLQDKMGERAMGPTLEGDGKEGAYVVTREVKQFPPVDATQGVATLLPVFGNPKQLFSRQVTT